MKKLMFGLLLFSLFGCLEYKPALAEDRIDLMKKNGPQYWCEAEASLFKEGIEARLTNVARAIKPLTQEMARDMANGKLETLPLDAIYYNPVELNERERAFFETTVLSGWDEAEKIIEEWKKRHPEDEGYSVNYVISPNTISKMGFNYFKNCMRLKVESGDREPI